jgi:predicted AlkP superfamily phosphohydrolase/phosphomutase
MMRTVIVGLDGATWSVLDPLIEAGKMPNLQRLVATGVKKTLMSTVPPVTAPAWISFATGQNPGQFGIYWFTRLDSDGYTLIPVNTAHVSNWIWDVLSGQGKTVGLLDIPMTFPPHPVNGVYVSGMGIPSLQSDFTCPSGLRDEILSIIPDYILDISWSDYSDDERLIHDVMEMTRQRVRLAHWFMDRMDFDFFMVVLVGIDRLSHKFWHSMTGEPRSAGDRIKDLLMDFYVQTDRAVGEIVDRFGGDALKIVVSDHGFGPFRRSINLNSWLHKNGFLAVRASTQKFRHVARKALELAGISWNRLRDRAGRTARQVSPIDFDRTVAFSRLPDSIYINLEGRFVRGIVRPGAEYERAREQICLALRDLRDPITGEPVIEAVHVREDVYSGPFVEQAPDILFTCREGYYVHAFEPDAPIFTDSDAKASGEHRPEGILAWNGPGVPNNWLSTESIGITDVVPAVLDAMSVAVAERDSRSTLRPGEGLQTASEANTYSIQDRKVVESRLRGLGYLD